MKKVTPFLNTQQNRITLPESNKIRPNEKRSVATTPAISGARTADTLEQTQVQQRHSQASSKPKPKAKQPSRRPRNLQQDALKQAEAQFATSYNELTAPSKNDKHVNSPRRNSSTQKQSVGSSRPQQAHQSKTTKASRTPQVAESYFNKCNRLMEKLQKANQATMLERLYSPKRNDTNFLNHLGERELRINDLQEKLISTQVEITKKSRNNLLTETELGNLRKNIGGLNKEVNSIADEVTNTFLKQLEAVPGLENVFLNLLTENTDKSSFVNPNVLESYAEEHAETNINDSASDWNIVSVATQLSDPKSPHFSELLAEATENVQNSSTKGSKSLKLEEKTIQLISNSVYLFLLERSNDPDVKDNFTIDNPAVKRMILDSMISNLLGHQRLTDFNSRD